MGICSAEKKLLIEEVGLHLEQHRKLSPLAARIYAIMILSCEQGFSFDELKEITSCSKSSLSTSINLLMQLDFIEYYTRPGERKRYFRGSNNYLKDTIADYLETVDTELKIAEKINKFNKVHNPNKFIKNESLGSIFQTYLSNQKSNLKATLEQMITFQNHRQLK